MGFQKHVLDEIVELVVAPQQPQTDARHVRRIASEHGIEVGRACLVELARSPARDHLEVRAAARLVPFMRRHSIDQSLPLSGQGNENQVTRREITARVQLDEAGGSRPSGTAHAKGVEFPVLEDQ